MKSKNKIVTVGIILTTIVLAGIAIFTAIRLYQTRNVAPTSSEAGAGIPKACELSFTVTGETSTIPDCTNLTTTANLNNLHVGTEYSFQLTAGGTAPITGVEMSVYNNVCSNNLKPYAVQNVSGPGTYTIKWTPTKVGPFTAYGRVWNDGIAECRADCVDGPPRYLCPNAQACKLTGVVTSVTTPTPTATPAPSCNSNCDFYNGSADQCGQGLSCLNVGTGAPQARCRNPLCSSSVSCICATATATTRATATATATTRATATATSTSTSHASATATATSTSTATATANPECNNSCTQNTDCPDGLMCNIPNGATTGSCRNTSCLSENNCLCPNPTQTATSIAQGPVEEPTLPNAGTSWPTIAGTLLGILIILGSLLLAF